MRATNFNDFEMCFFKQKGIIKEYYSLTRQTMFICITNLQTKKTLKLNLGKIMKMDKRDGEVIFLENIDY